MGGGDCRDNPYNCADAPNPLPAANTVWLEEMTWMDVRDALKAGKTTVIVPTGGIEPNGPWLVLGKHNYVLHANCDAIARKLGNALCAPIVKLVPEGEIDPPQSHMRSPGTLSMREDTFRAVLEDIARSLKAHGFKTIIFIGDSGGNQGGQRAVAEKLNAEWSANPIVAHVQEYYDYDGVARHMEGQGIKDGESDNLHDDPIITLNMFIDDPKSVRYDERLKAKKASINGVDLSDRQKSTELAKKIVEFRAQHTVDFINKAIANKGTLPAPPARGRGGATGAGQAPAGPPQGRGANRPAPDPRTMGGGECRENPYNCSDTPNPLPAANTVWLEEMTWMDVRDALKAGKTTAIVSTGGIEPNGPWLVLGKHNYVLRGTCDAIAKKLGNALCAPDHPARARGPRRSAQRPHAQPRHDQHARGHVPGGADRRRAQPEDARLPEHHLHRRQRRQSERPENRRREVERAVECGARSWPTSASTTRRRRARPTCCGSSASPRRACRATACTTARGSRWNMMLTDPKSVRWEERVKAGKATINGVSIADKNKSLEWAKKIVDARADRTVVLIKKAIASKGKVTTSTQ